MRRHLTFLFAFLAGIALAQQPITLEKIWAEYEFVPEYVSGFNFLNDGQSYTRLEGDKVVKYDLLRGRQLGVVFDGAQAANDQYNGQVHSYAFSADEQKLLISTETEQIYRHSTRARYFVWDLETQTLTPVFREGKIRYATFSPQGDKVAFVYENNLYYKDLNSGEVVQVTRDGKRNEIINGATDWVYEEEFGFARAFQWSPDGQRIAFYRFDERQVPEFTMTNYKGGLYPEYVTFKYPKVGQPNSIVTIHVYHLDRKMTRQIATGDETDIYIPRIKWTRDPYLLCVFRMNRHQNRLELLLAETTTGKTSLMLEETSKWYIDIHDNLTFLADGRHFIWTSEQDGYNHIYLYDMGGQLVRQLTKGPWEVTDFYGVDEANGMIYFQAAMDSPMDRKVYAVRLDGKGRIKKLNRHDGWNSAQFSSTFDYFVNTWSTINTPPVFTVCDRNGKELRVIEGNIALRDKQRAYGVSQVEFFDFTTSEGVALNGWMIKPPAFDATKQYPVLMYVYGGPGSQQVTDAWKGQNYWWFQMLAQQGFIVACVDNRGTGGRGAEFKKMTYLQLGHYETIDQIEAARYLGSQPWVDAERIGIFGWSYGGYMSSLCLLKGNDVFKAAIAVAPVTNWKWYDTIYTERYMRTASENPEGYEQNSPVNFADRLKGNYLIIHGMGDDNVHFQHTAEMVNALIAANKQFDTYFYPNRNHGI
ncbi:MAG: S9 family peptidase, partial [Bacteroidetes bacterium]